MRNTLFYIVIASALAACTPATQAPKMALGATPVLDGGRYSTGGGLTVAAQTRQIAGMTALCGVWAESSRQSILSKGAAQRVMHTGSAYLGDTVLHRDLSFMAQVEPAEVYAGQTANCVQTTRPWTGSSQVLQLRLPRQVVNRQINSDDGASIEVVFSQSGPGATNPSLKSLVLGE